ncbi:MAG TPA: hypothetical protein VGL72_30835 [Bryobacteraceae bacterium]
MRQARLCAAFLLAAASVQATTFYLTIAGLGGEPDYEQRFKMLADETDKLLKAGGPDRVVTTLQGPGATKPAILNAIDKFAHDAKGPDSLVVMLIGHGSFDGVDYKFNIPGPDLTATELAQALNRVPASRQLVVNMTSSSGGSIAALRKEGRVVVCATRNGTEKNATVFARFWVEALRDPAADTDKNETVSALEAFRYAQQKTGKFYDDQKRLATEHAVIEDTGKGTGERAPSADNGVGLRAAAFPLVRFGSAKTAATDPQKKALLEQRDQIQAKIDQLKFEKTTMDPAAYKQNLTSLLLDLARVQEAIDK